MIYQTLIKYYINMTRILFFKYNKFMPFIPLVPMALHNNKHIFCEYDRKNMIERELTLTDTNQFKKDFDKFEPVKVIGQNRCNFQYKLGLNENNENFIAQGDCSGGGLYFVDSSNVFEYFRSYGHKVASIKLIDNEPIWIEKDGKCKTNKFYITKIETIGEYLNNLSEEQQLESIKFDAYLIKLITNRSENFLLKSIKNNPKTIFYLKKSLVLEMLKLYPELLEIKIVYKYCMNNFRLYKFI